MLKIQLIINHLGNYKYVINKLDITDFLFRKNSVPTFVPYIKNKSQLRDLSI